MSTQRHCPDCEVTIKTELPPLPVEGKARLRKLIAFLEELPRRKFAFARIISAQEHGCGTVCCAYGWTPALFPDLAQWRQDGHAIFVKGDTESFFTGTSLGTRLLFGVSNHVAHHLLYPNSQDEIHRDLPNCGPEATAKQVAAMLAAYIALTETPVL